MTISLPNTTPLLEVAKRVVWFKKPEDTLKNPYHFLAYLMTFGTVEDVKVVRQYLTDADFVEALKNAPPGIFDERSWTYWHLVLCQKNPAPPMPIRQYPQEDLLSSPKNADRLLKAMKEIDNQIISKDRKN